MVGEALSHRLAGRESTATIGPESPTLAERLVAAFRLPYGVGCLVVGTILFGLVDVVLSTYAQTSNLPRAVTTAFAPVNVVIGVLVAYSFYAPRYMRGRLVQAGVLLSRLLPNRGKGYREAFAGVAASRPQLATWALFLAGLLVATNTPALLGTGPSTIVFGGGPGTLLELAIGMYNIVSIAVATLGLSAVVWTYWSISRGIHRFGSAPLDLRPYYEDAFLGLRPVGSLSLSLASAYFGFIGLFGLALAASPTSPTVGDFVGVGGFLSGLIVLGLVLFFLPLRRLHRLMAERKQLEGARLRETLGTVFQEPDVAGSPKDIGHLFRVDMMDRKFSSMAVWPFDMRILGKLSVIAISVTAILISRIVALVLKI